MQKNVEIRKVLYSTERYQYGIGPLRYRTVPSPTGLIFC